jgi:hypothetical protein
VVLSVTGVSECLLDEHVAPRTFNTVIDRV